MYFIGNGKFISLQCLLGVAKKDQYPYSLIQKHQNKWEIFNLTLNILNKNSSFSHLIKFKTNCLKLLETHRGTWDHFICSWIRVK